MFLDNKKLNSICQEQENIIQQYEEDKLVQKIEDISFEINELKNSIKLKDENLNIIQNQNEQMKNHIDECENNIHNLSKFNDTLKIENEGLKNNILDVKNKNTLLQKNNEQLQTIIYDKERDINNLGSNLKAQKKIINDHILEKTSISNERDNLNNEILRLKEANNNLMNRIKNILESNQQIKQEINRRDKINGVLRKNKRNIERSLYTFNTNSTLNNSNLNMSIHSEMIGRYNKDYTNSPLMDKSTISYSPKNNNNLNMSS